jgi:dTDP-4-amino-4,6-dideoxygalactose transaminase
METLLTLSNIYSVPIVEDACQAHGAQYLIDGEWKMAGSQGKAAGFSFYPGKNLGAMGDGGAVATNDTAMAALMRTLRDHGSTTKYNHETSQGWNSRLDALQAAILSIKLRRLDSWNAGRRRAAAWYIEMLDGLPFQFHHEIEGVTSVYHLFVIRAQDRERLRRELNQKGIGVGLHYPVPLHLQPAFRHLNLEEGMYPMSELAAATLLSLPMHPGLTRLQVETVAKTCNSILMQQMK